LPFNGTYFIDNTADKIAAETELSGKADSDDNKKCEAGLLQILNTNDPPVPADIKSKSVGNIITPPGDHEISIINENIVQTKSGNDYPQEKNTTAEIITPAETVTMNPASKTSVISDKAKPGKINTAEPHDYTSQPRENKFNILWSPGDRTDTGDTVTSDIVKADDTYISAGKTAAYTEITDRSAKAFSDNIKAGAGDILPKLNNASGITLKKETVRIGSAAETVYVGNIKTHVKKNASVSEFTSEKKEQNFKDTHTNKQIVKEETAKEQNFRIASAEIYTGKENNIKTAAGKSDVVNQVAHSVAEMTRNNKNSLMIELSPAELGKIKVELKYSDGKLDVKIVAENDAVMKVLDNRLGQLETAFSKNNIEVKNIDISVNNGSALSNDLSGGSRQSYNNSGKSEDYRPYNGETVQNAENEDIIRYYAKEQLLNYLI
jgi:flagellar hook-length control protein FliK